MLLLLLLLLIQDTLTLEPPKVITTKEVDIIELIR